MTPLECLLLISLVLVPLVLFVVHHGSEEEDKTMKQGLLVSCLDAKDLIEALEATAAIGYRNCEISVCPDDRRPSLATLDSAGREAAVQRARELGMNISAVQCHIHNGYGDASPAARTAAVEHTIRMIDLCAELEIPVLHTVSGVAEDGAPREEKLGRVADSCRNILDHARGGPVKVGIEPVYVYIVGNRADMNDLLALLDDRDDLLINYDPSHFPYHDEPAEEFVRAFGERIVHAHSKDAVVTPRTDAHQPEQDDAAPMPGDRLFRFAAPGEGVLDWDAIMAALKEVGFDGVISLEMGHGYRGTPRDVARATYEFFRTKFGLL